MRSPIVTFTREGNAKLKTQYAISLGRIHLTIPKGFVTDGASIPWFVQWFGDPFDGDTLPGAIVHDCLYQSQGKFRLGKEIISSKRRIVDTLFLRIMEANKVNFLKRSFYFAAVRLFGWLPWLLKDGDRKLLQVKFIK